MTKETLSVAVIGAGMAGGMVGGEPIPYSRQSYLGCV